jgi:lipid II:glycine glycyltransferase (peptidoglycan interpeptide bridge formation enzyme)
MRSLRWQVRFDHEPLAIILSSLGLVYRRVQIHVLKLDRDYGDLFEHYHATTRNHVRKAARRGVVVRSTCDVEDIFAYQAIYSRHAENKNWGFEYPAQLTMALVEMSGKACFKVAQYNNKIIGGALFVRDGNSVYYLHGVADRDHSRLFPASAVLDAGIQWACESGAEFLNLGNSGISPINTALATFKSSWGAHAEQNWLFDWENPLWNCAAKLKAGVLKLLPIPSKASKAPAFRN